MCELEIICLGILFGLSSTGICEMEWKEGSDRYPWLTAFLYEMVAFRHLVNRLNDLRIMTLL